jgi:hypothetical protein
MSERDSYQNLINFIEGSADGWQESLAAPPYNISVKEHPLLPGLFKLKYSQYDSPFADPIVRCCRGSVLEVEGKGAQVHARIVQAPYFKFCNWRREGVERGEDVIDWSGRVRALDKLDGSLIIFSKYQGRPLWTTSGSFGIDTECPDAYDTVTEPETLKLRTFWELITYCLEKTHTARNPGDTGNAWMERVGEGWTLMFELVSPRNRVICKYPETKLILHGARNPEMAEVSAEAAKQEFGLPFDTPRWWPVANFAEAAAIINSEYTDGSRREGLVILDAKWNRVKIKSESYLELKNIKGEDHFSEKYIFEAIKKDSIDDVIAAWPEVKEIAERVECSITAVRKVVDGELPVAREKYAGLLEANGSDGKEARKQYAFWVKNERHLLPASFLFEALKPDFSSRDVIEKMDYRAFLIYMDTMGIKSDTEAQ